MDQIIGSNALPVLKPIGAVSHAQWESVRGALDVDYDQRRKQHDVLQGNQQYDAHLKT